MSFFIQLDKSDGSPAFLFRFAWRLIVLFIIGLVHHLHYRGDILTIYAVLGFGLLLCHKLPDKFLLVLALLLVVDTPAILQRTFDILLSNSASPFPIGDEKELEIYYSILKSGSYLDMLRANFYEFKSKFDFQILSGRLYITMGLFLLGLYAGRKKVFENIPFFKKLIRLGLWMLLGCVVFAGLLALIIFVAKVEMSQAVQFLLGGTVYDVFNIALAAIYVGLIVTAFQREKWHRRLMNFYEVGRMGLTSYLMQALIGTWLLFSYGLALLGNFGASVWAAISLIVFALQIVFSKWWLGRFQYGPAEWLWRSLTYFKVWPLKK
jgi:uncharacterized protein